MRCCGHALAIERTAGKAPHGQAVVPQLDAGASQRLSHPTLEHRTALLDGIGTESSADSCQEGRSHLGYEDDRVAAGRAGGGAQEDPRLLCRLQAGTCGLQVGRLPAEGEAQSRLPVAVPDRVRHEVGEAEGLLALHLHSLGGDYGYAGVAVGVLALLYQFDVRFSERPGLGLDGDGHLLLDGCRRHSRPPQTRYILVVGRRTRQSRERIGIGSPSVLRRLEQRPVEAGGGEVARIGIAGPPRIHGPHTQAARFRGGDRLDLPSEHLDGRGPPELHIELQTDAAGNAEATAALQSRPGCLAGTVHSPVPPTVSSRMRSVG